MLCIKGAISRKRQVFEKIAQKSILTFHWLKIRHWNAVCACAFSYSRVDFNVRVYVWLFVTTLPRVKCTRLGLRGTMTKRGGRREGSGRKKLDVCKSKRIRISEDLFQRWKDLKRIRKARSDEELVAYVLDLATATDLSDSPRCGEKGVLRSLVWASLACIASDIT